LIKISNYRIVYVLTNTKDLTITAAINITEISKTYPGASRPALDKVSAVFEAGKIHSIIGLSGAGKSTLMRCFNLLEKPDSGALTILGKDTSRLSSSEQRDLLCQVGTIFQSVNLLTRLTALENVMLPQQWRGVASESATLRARDLLIQVGLGGLEDRYPSQLSGGQRQRVAIARALANDAKILLCDEFTSALDPQTSLDILALLKALNRDLGVTIVLITHDMAVVREISDFVYVMEQGQFVEQGDLEQILLHPQQLTTKKLLANLFEKELPNHIKENLSESPVMGDVLIRLVFSGKSSREPVIADLIKTHEVNLSILAGNMDHLRQSVFGTLLLSAPYSDPVLEKMMAHFSKHGVAAEILGYLAKDGEL
jgi:D-methionine transport system ATP-binding protein